MWELDCEESWVLKNWCFWTVVLEKTLEIPLDCKEIQPVHSKGDQSWVFFGRTDAKAETPVLWPFHAKNWFIGKDWCWEGLGAGGEGDDREWDIASSHHPEARWHHQLNGCESELRELVMDIKAWRGAIHGVAKSRIQLSEWTKLKRWVAGSKAKEAEESILCPKANFPRLKKEKNSESLITIHFCLWIETGLMFFLLMLVGSCWVLVIYRDFWLALKGVILKKYHEESF